MQSRPELAKQPLQVEEGRGDSLNTRWHKKRFGDLESLRSKQKASRKERGEVDEASLELEQQLGQAQPARRGILHALRPGLCFLERREKLQWGAERRMMQGATQSEQIAESGGELLGLQGKTLVCEQEGARDLT